MIIAEQKKKENIVEYLIYMYQVEDLIRANEFDMNRLEESVVNQFDIPYDTKREMLEWYKDLVGRMKEEGITRTGHLMSLNIITNEINSLHLRLIGDVQEMEYRRIYEEAKPNIEALKRRSKVSEDHDIQVILNGLYGFLILRIRKVEISEETRDAFHSISELIALLSSKYMESVRQ